MISLGRGGGESDGLVRLHASARGAVQITLLGWIVAILPA